jgi:hypothetical protein
MKRLKWPRVVGLIILPAIVWIIIVVVVIAIV